MVMCLWLVSDRTEIQTQEQCGFRKQVLSSQALQYCHRRTAKDCSFRKWGWGGEGVRFRMADEHSTQPNLPAPSPEIRATKKF